MNFHDKQKIHAACIEYIQQKVQQLQLELNAIQESVLSESKSSAGDKHETSREMIAQEQNRVGKQLEEIQNQLRLLESVSMEASDAFIRKGSLVETTNGMFYLAVGIGKLMVDHMPVFCISMDSPLGKLMVGKKIHNTFTIQDKEIQIISVI